MRKWVILGLAIAVVGCGGPASSPDVPEAPAGPEPALIGAADLDAAHAKELELTYEGRHLKVGDTLSSAQNFYPEPSTGKKFPLRDLPQGLGPEFHVTGWEKGSRGLGLIVLDDRVALGMITETGKSEISGIVDAAEIYTRRFADVVTPSLVSGVSGRYWFWEQGQARLMICAAVTLKGDWTMTIALGHVKVMNRLRMSVAMAKEDLDAADHAESGTDPSR